MISDSAVATPTSATVTNIQTANLTSASDVNVDTTGWTGLTQLNVVSAATGPELLTAATTTSLHIVNSTAENITTVGGGGTASVTAGAAAIQVGNATDPTAADANAFTSVTAKNSGENNVDITDNSGTAGAVGSTLTTVSVIGMAGTATLTGKGLVNVSLKDTGGNVTITNTTAGHALNLTVTGVTAGIVDDAVATSAVVTSAADTAAATTVALDLTGAKIAALTVGGTKSVDLTSNTALGLQQTVTVTGSGGLVADLSGDGAGTVNGFVTSVDTTGSSAATSAANGTTSNQIIIGTSTSFAGGAGVDAVTTGASTKAITLGDGNDSLTLTALLATGGTADGGAGTNTVVLTNALAAGISTSAFNAKISNFERLGISAVTLGADAVVELGYLPELANYVKFDGFGAAAHTETVNNLLVGGTVELAGDNALSGAGGLILNVQNAGFGASDTFNLLLSDTAAGVRAGGVVTMAGVENVNIHTSMTAATFAATTDTLSLTDSTQKIMVISGNAGLNLTDTGTTLTSVDASGITGTGNRNTFTWATGALAANAVIHGTAVGVNNIDATLVAAGKHVTIDVGGTANTSSNILIGSAGADTITGGSGNDTITSGGGLDSLTGGAGADKFIITDASGTANAGAQVNILDFATSASAALADTLSFTGNAATGAYAGTVGAGWTDTSGILTKAGAIATDFMAMINADFVGGDADKVAAFSDGTNTFVAAVDNAGTAVTFVELVGVTGLTSVATTAGAHALLVG